MTTDDYIEKILPLLSNPNVEPAEKREVLQEFAKEVRWRGAVELVMKTFERRIDDDRPLQN